MQAALLCIFVKQKQIFISISAYKKTFRTENKKTVYEREKKNQHSNVWRSRNYLAPAKAKTTRTQN